MDITFPGGLYGNDIELQNGKYYTYSARVYPNSEIIMGSAYPLYPATNGGSYDSSNCEIVEVSHSKIPAGTWTDIYIVFKIKGANVKFQPWLYHGTASGVRTSFADVQLEEGKIRTPWSQHPQEIYDGVTTIDKNGVKVSQSNYNGYTQMKADGFYVNNGSENVISVTKDGATFKGKVTIQSGSTVPTSTLSGTISNSQLNSTITSDISTAKTNASTALSTANSVNTTVNNGKTNWNNAYNRVNEWAYGAVTGSTTIDGGLIQSNTIVADKIKTGSITATQIAARTITASEIASGTITATQIKSGTITATQLASNAITADKIASNAITGKTISGGTITGTSISGGTISGISISGGTISGSNISGATFTSSGTDSNSYQYQTMSLDSGALRMTGSQVGGTNDGQEINKTYLTSMGLVVKDSSYSGFGGNANALYTNTGIYWNPKGTGGEEYPNWHQTIGFYDDYILLDNDVTSAGKYLGAGLFTTYTNLYVGCEGEVRATDMNGRNDGNTVYKPIRASKFMRADGKHAYINNTGGGTLTSADSALVANGMRTNATDFYLGVDGQLRVTDKNGYNNGNGLKYKPITASAHNNSSDLIFKKNIKKLDDSKNIKMLSESEESFAIKTLKDVTVYEYDLVDGEENQIGLIAQECPQVLRGSDAMYDLDIETANSITDEERKELINEDVVGASINLYSMATMLWKVCQEQQTMIEKLEKRIEELENK